MTNLPYSHLLVSRLSLDVAVLCEYLDSLCARLVIAAKLRECDSLHNMTMPRSWILQAVPLVGKLRSKNVDLLPLYVAPMADLLEWIYNPDACMLILLQEHESPLIPF